MSETFYDKAKREAAKGNGDSDPRGRCRIIVGFASLAIDVEARRHEILSWASASRRSGRKSAKWIATATAVSWTRNALGRSIMSSRASSADKTSGVRSPATTCACEPKEPAKWVKVGPRDENGGQHFKHNPTISRANRRETAL